MRTDAQFAYGAILDYWVRWRAVRLKIERARPRPRRSLAGSLALAMIIAKR